MWWLSQRAGRRRRQTGGAAVVLRTCVSERSAAEEPRSAEEANSSLDEAHHRSNLQRMVEATDQGVAMPSRTAAFIASRSAAEWSTAGGWTSARWVGCTAASRSAGANPTRNSCSAGAGSSTDGAPMETLICRGQGGGGGKGIVDFTTV